MASGYKRNKTAFCSAFILLLFTLKNVNCFKDSDPITWPGHMEPLASKAKHIPVQTLYQFPNPQEFFLNFVYPSIPVIFKNGAKRSPSFYKWSNHYLRNQRDAKSTLVEVEMKQKEDRNLPAVKMPFDEFMTRFQEHNEYLVAGVPSFLQRDVLIPPPLLCDAVFGHFLDSLLWISYGGAKSVLHSDAVENINCVYSGTKDFLLLNTTKYKHQVLIDVPERAYSQVDVDQVDFTKYPFLADVEFHIAHVSAGDCIYLPYKWLHQVNSFGRSIAVNVWWDHMANIVPTPENCGRPNPQTSLADISFRHHEERKLHKLSNQSKDDQAFADPFTELLNQIKASDGQRFDATKFATFMQQEVIRLDSLHWTTEVLTKVNQVFKTLDVNSDDWLTPSDMEDITSQKHGEIQKMVVNKVYELLEVMDEQLAANKEEFQHELRNTVEKINQSQEDEQTNETADDETSNVRVVGHSDTIHSGGDIKDEL